MLIIFELHGYRGFRITVTAGQAMATLFFVTFGGMALTMSSLLTSVRMDAIQDIATDMRDAVIEHGGQELFQQVSDCMGKAAGVIPTR